MPKGYLIARVTVTDPDAYARYAALSSEAMRLYGGKPLVRGGRHQALEGEARQRNVVLEFESMERALEYYNSPEYQAAKRERDGACVAEFVVVEGVD